MPFLKKFLFLGLFAVLFTTSFSFGQLKNRGQNEPDWLESYYLDPKPDEFMTHLKQWAEDGVLQNHQSQPALIAFISQLMRQNRDKIESWTKSLEGMDEKDAVAYGVALMMSRTKEADAIIKQNLGADAPKNLQRPPKFLEMPLRTPATIDMLWGFFYATGNEQALRRISLCFIYEGMTDKPEGFEIPEGQTPIYKHLPEVAFISLSANAKRHPKVLEALEKFVAEPAHYELHALELENLNLILSQVAPDKYPPKQKTPNPENTE
ncbi:MAG: hypothetical protein AAF226_07115 [Verrucomicrobiota bacterium]